MNLSKYYYENLNILYSGTLEKCRRKRKKTYQIILIRYFTERLIYRLSVSDYKKHFCLKGGALLYAFEQESSRPTMDLDLLGLRIANDQQQLMLVFQAICQMECPEDGILFLHETITTSEIQKEGRYSGVRLKIDGRLGNIRQVSQIDIGFGDVVTPAPVEMTFPTLLPLPEPKILAYSIETVIAEKFEAMISLAAQNSRMKDFYDVFRLLQYHHIQEEVLAEAIQNTFARRETPFQKNHVIFREEFGNNPRREVEWQAFLKKINKHIATEPLVFEQVMLSIAERLQPIYEKLSG